jgi:pimeloyl-ACP methyl ester carboxylesterase
MTEAPPAGRFVYRTGEDERLFAETEDGWRLAMYRYRPRGAPRPYPIVAGHGLAGSRLIYDLGREASLARALAAAGFDVYTVDLRGRGMSWPPRRRRGGLQWSFDDIAERDLPAAIARACEVSGAPGAFWLGMEMSGQALYAATILGRAGSVRGAVTFGAPVETPADAQVPGVTSPVLEPQGGRIPLGAGARAAGPILAYAKSDLLESSFRPSNSDPLMVSRYFVRGVPDESTVLVDQFAAWVREGVMRNLDGSVVYSARLGEVRRRRPPAAPGRGARGIRGIRERRQDVRPSRGGRRVQRGLRPRRPARRSGGAGRDLPHRPELARREERAVREGQPCR